MNNEIKDNVFNPIHDFEIAASDELAKEGDLATNELRVWLENDSGELFQKLAESSKLSGYRFTEFQKTFNVLKQLFDEVQELRQALQQMKTTELPIKDITEVEVDLGEKIKVLNEKMLFTAKEYMDVIKHSTEDLTDIEN